MNRRDEETRRRRCRTSVPNGFKRPRSCVAAGVPPAVEPVRPARRQERPDSRKRSEHSDADPGGETRALHGSQDGRHYNAAAAASRAPTRIVI